MVQVVHVVGMGLFETRIEANISIMKYGKVGTVVPNIFRIMGDN